MSPKKAACSIRAAPSDGMFVSWEKFVEEHGGRVGDIVVYGQESNHTTWKMARNRNGHLVAHPAR